jgi:hypothetical protein
VQELPLLESELAVRPDLSSHVHSSSGSGRKQLDLKHQVSLLAEGQRLPLTALSEHISKLVSSASADGAQAAGAGKQQQQQQQQQPSRGAGPTPLVVRNLILEVAGRKSYALQDGE